jgi:hypothetical protein
MKYLLLIPVALLVGCATPRPAIDPPPRVVNVPVAVKCETPLPARPDFRFQPPYSDVFAGVRDLLGDRELARSYEIELEAALQSCK